MYESVKNKQLIHGKQHVTKDAKHVLYGAWPFNQNSELSVINTYKLRKVNKAIS